MLSYNTGRIYELTKDEVFTLGEMIHDMPAPLVLAKYGIKHRTADTVTFVSPEDAFAMKFILIDNTLEHDHEEV